MNVWHICCTTGDMCNGMVQVIPEHVNNQASFANVLLINLAEYKPKVNNSIPVYNIHEFKRKGFYNLVNEMGKPDIIIMHGIYLPKLWNFWYKYIYTKIPYVVIPHGSLTFQTQSKNRLKKIVGNSIVVKKIVKHATLLQYLSQGEKITSTTMGNNCTYIGPNGIYTKRKTNKKIIDNKIRIIYIGRYDLFHKGLDILLEACMVNRDFLSDSNVKIEMYGKKEESDYDEISAYIQNSNLSDIISINGPVYGVEKEDKYMSGTYFILTSRLEGLPMGALEACSYGVPLLITETTNMGDDVRRFNNGCVVDTSVDGISKLFKFAIDNLDCYEEMSVSSFECAKRYDWKVVAQDAITAYRKCLSIKE